jgi:adenylate cyclase
MFRPLKDQPFRVLIVDDVKANIDLVEASLAPMGYNTTRAENGLQCLEMVRKDPPDLILLDVMMPGISGFQVCYQLKQDPEFRHIPIILVTALDGVEDRISGIEAGCDDFISKPFDRHELLARVKSLLRLKRLEERERFQVRRALERYVDSNVAQEILSHDGEAIPGCKRVDATVLFADVRGFTSWSESLAPEDVVGVINTFLSQAVEIVFKHGGSIDKFTGDGLMAIFGAPVSMQDHPNQAALAALEIIEKAHEILPPTLTESLQVGCGINSGPMVVGNIGSERRLDWTAIGDVVNVASRLTSEALPGQVLVSAATAERLDHPSMTDLGEKHVKNRHEPVHVFSLNGIPIGDRPSKFN